MPPKAGMKMTHIERLSLYTPEAVNPEAVNPGTTARCTLSILFSGEARLVPTATYKCVSAGSQATTAHHTNKVQHAWMDATSCASLNLDVARKNQALNPKRAYVFWYSIPEL